MISNEVYLVLFFALLPVCSGATATIPIKRTTIRFKFDDWQLYNEYAGAFQQREPFTASIDLSWSDMFVPSVQCLQDPVTALYCRGQNMYNSSLSTTYHQSKTVTKLMYEGLSTLGYLSQDVLRVGGLDILDQQFEEATFWRSMYSNAAPLDSALGLARLQSRTPASNASTKSALRSMLNQKVLSRPVFSLRLPRRDDESGELVLGYSPSEVLAQSAVTLPLIEATPPKELSQLSYYISSGYTVELESITIQSSPGNSPSGRKSSTHKAVFTNSFDYISLPGTLLTEIQTNLHPDLGMDDQLADLDCSMRDDLPNIVFSFGKNAVIVLTPWDYLTEVRDIEKGTRCVLPFAYLQQTDDEWVVLGSAFMEGVYSAFDLEKGEVSLSMLKE
ncbi:acid protease [Cucurbitaria berberidis CBS 394.84]|uniref:Acid protease n=1 Tax=Cucurbitaria berberidis CBS 394.84 TaxID=1168544 RepID=A0A9P4GAU5_9PLEO|nr:acid protease [Cucurbitaria berberidis CBS 394.84]KAF1842129.1 acid protease [Cucurbitaria berberidis CBS 394.84]